MKLYESIFHEESNYKNKLIAIWKKGYLPYNFDPSDNGSEGAIRVFDSKISTKIILELDLYKDKYGSYSRIDDDFGRVSLTQDGSNRNISYLYVANATALMKLPYKKYISPDEAGDKMKKDKERKDKGYWKSIGLK